MKSILLYSYRVFLLVSAVSSLSAMNKTAAASKESEQNQLRTSSIRSFKKFVEEILKSEDQSQWVPRFSDAMRHCAEQKDYLKLEAVGEALTGKIASFTPSTASLFLDFMKEFFRKYESLMILPILKKTQAFHEALINKAGSNPAANSQPNAATGTRNKRFSLNQPLTPADIPGVQPKPSTDQRNSVDHSGSTNSNSPSTPAASASSLETTTKVLKGSPELEIESLTELLKALPETQDGTLNKIENTFELEIGCMRGLIEAMQASERPLKLIETSINLNAFKEAAKKAGQPESPKLDGQSVRLAAQVKLLEMLTQKYFETLEGHTLALKQTLSAWAFEELIQKLEPQDQAAGYELIIKMYEGNLNGLLNLSKCLDANARVLEALRSMGELYQAHERKPTEKQQAGQSTMSNEQVQKLRLAIRAKMLEKMKQTYQTASQALQRTFDNATSVWNSEKMVASLEETEERK